MEKEIICEHKWIPNGITTKELWYEVSDQTNRNEKQGERVYASCICEKCGEIKIKSN